MIRGESLDPTQDELDWGTLHGLAHTDTPKPDGATGDSIEWIERAWSNATQSCIQTLAILEPPLDCPAERSILCTESADPTPDELAWAAQHGLTYWDDGPKPLPEGTCGIEWIQRFWGEHVGDPNACTQGINIMHPGPVVKCPPDASVSGCGISLSDITPALTGMATVDDPCGLTVSLGYLDTYGIDLNPGPGQVHREWTVTGACGETDSCIQTITWNAPHPYIDSSFTGTFAAGHITYEIDHINPRPMILGNDQAHQITVAGYASHALPAEEAGDLPDTATVSVLIDGTPAGSTSVSLFAGEVNIRFDVDATIPPVIGCHIVTVTMGSDSVSGCVFVHPIDVSPGG